MARTDPLPAYERPPVIEVVMSVQFDPLTRLTPAHLGLWWSQHRERYPLCEERQPLQPQTEEFGTTAAPSFELRLSGVPPAPAVWFVREDRTELVQVQRDRFTRNWTRESPEASPYPSYTRLLPKFREDLQDFESFVETEGFGRLDVRQVEITYINPIPLPSGPEGLPSVFEPWAGEYSERFLPAPEDANIALRWQIGSDAGPIGRLHARVATAIRESDRAVILELTARGKPSSRDIGGAFEFLDVGHEWIVRSFTALTTAEMHLNWGRSHAP